MIRSSYILCLFLVLLLVAAGIPAASATPTISSVSPGTGPRGETVTLEISGSGFSSGSSVYLYKCGQESAGGSQRRFSGSIKRVTSGSIVASFYLGNDLKLGDYGVIVNTPTQSFATDEGHRANVFQVCSGSSCSSSASTTTEPTTGVTTSATQSEGENSIFFETNPSGATIYLDGNEIGTAAFTYKTDMDGSHAVRVKKIGYEDYEDRVNIVEGQRTRFYAQLNPLASTSGSGTTTIATTSASGTGKPAGNATTIRKSTLKMPTPLGTDAPPAEESPVDPAAALLAITLGIAFLAIRRR